MTAVLGKRKHDAMCLAVCGAAMVVLMMMEDDDDEALMEQANRRNTCSMYAPIALDWENSNHSFAG